ncbi:MAG: Gfo/Idh/MocA family oxidoreductase [Planctomycetota bacterium]|nr:Gfo/Idh/MocA family oxidoreductase [Planctomycetota bacterium]
MSTPANSTNSTFSTSPLGVSRRDFVKASASATLGASAALSAAGGVVGSLASAVFSTGVARAAYAGGTDSIKIGVIGCGGRGSGAAVDALNADPAARVVAMGDVFADRVKSARENLAQLEDTLKSRIVVADKDCHVGFDAYKAVLASDVDMVILATPPHFRPIHFEAAVGAGKHVFMEKPVAVDPVGVRRVIAASDAADAKKLCVVSGTQRRHQNSYIAAMKRLHAGDIGPVMFARCSWDQGSLWNHARKPEYSDMEWQLRNWLYFTWLSGDHIVEQHIHNIDVINWGLQATPTRATAQGGRQVRTGAEFGHVFDHFAVEFEYPTKDGRVVRVLSTCRQIDGCVNRVDEFFQGAEGTLHTQPGRSIIEGRKAWRYDPRNADDGPNDNPYEVEHRDLFAAIHAGKPVNEARRVAESTLTAIMGRMAAYTGKEVTWEFAMNSKLDLSPEYTFEKPLSVPAVATPGKSALV